MSTSSPGSGVGELRVRVSQEVFPPGHALHGTPHPMVRRMFTFDLAQGTVQVEQTDYGHPGRFNPGQPKRLPPILQPKSAQLVAAAEALGRLMD